MAIDFRPNFRLVFPVLPVENLYFRTGLLASPDSAPSEEIVSGLRTSSASRAVVYFAFYSLLSRGKFISGEAPTSSCRKDR
jgi:hypothetical protein